MATTRTATTRWEGTLTDGKGRVSLDSSGVGSFDVSWPARSEAPGGQTSPEELIAGAQSACLSMALSSALTKGGNPPEQLEISAEVGFQPGEGITGVTVSVRGVVPGMDEPAFRAAVEQAAANCPVSKALAGTTVTVRDVRLG